MKTSKNISILINLAEAFQKKVLISQNA